MWDAHGPDCAENCGGSQLQFIDKVVDSRSCAEADPHGPDCAAEPGGRFHSCRSWTRLLTCPLLSNVRCPWSWLRRKLWRFHSCSSSTKSLTSLFLRRGRSPWSRLCSRTAWKIPQLQVLDTVGDMPAVVQRQVSMIMTVLKARFYSCSTSTRWSMSLLFSSCWFHRCRLWRRPAFHGLLIVENIVEVQPAPIMEYVTLAPVLMRLQWPLRQRHQQSSQPQQCRSSPPRVCWRRTERFRARTERSLCCEIPELSAFFFCANIPWRSRWYTLRSPSETSSFQRCLFW